MMSRAYEPLDWQKGVGYRASLTLPRGDKPQCRAAVYRSREWGSGQCTKPGKHQGADGIWWCDLHEPEREARREAETRARQDAAYHKDRLQNTYGWTGRKLRDALREIANGHNDPRSLAIEVLGKMLTEELP